MKKDRLATGGGLIEMGSNRNDILFGSGAPVKDNPTALRREPFSTGCKAAISCGRSERRRRVESGHSLKPPK
jgi:hypothetical protein